MQRTIIGFHQDAAQEWVADLACGQQQHVRHTPPWLNRPWVLSPEGRRRLDYNLGLQALRARGPGERTTDVIRMRAHLEACRFHEALHTARCLAHSGNAVPKTGHRHTLLSR